MPPLFARLVVKYARNASRQRRRVRPRRAIRAGVERVDDLLSNVSALGQVCPVVGGPEPLGALPSDEHFVVRRVGLDRGAQPGALVVGEVLGAGAEDGLDPEQRVALASSIPEGVLLDSAADLIDRGGAELHDMERVEYGGGVLQLVVDRGLVTGERVQCRDFHVLAEGVAALVAPGCVGLPGLAWHEVEQPGPCLSTAVAGEADHPGQLLRSSLAGIDVMPDVFVDAEGGDAVESGLVGGQLHKFGFDGPPHRLP